MNESDSLRCMGEDRHLIGIPNREDIAVERLLGLLPFLHPAWYESLGIDHHSHWALVRPLLQKPMADLRQAEIDIVLGRMKVLADENGHAKFVWPPPTDYLVAVEAKCQVVTWEDTESWASAVTPKINLRQQLERNLDLGFHRVAALHVVAAPPSEDYWGVMRAARALGNYYLPIANGHLLDLVGKLSVGHAVLAMAGVSWKHEGDSGTVLPMKIIPSPLSGMGLQETALLQIQQFLATCPAPRNSRAVFVRNKGQWLPLDSTFN